MASSLLTLYKHEYDLFDDDDEKQPASYSDHKTRIQVWKRNPEKFKEWMKENEQKQVVFAFPTNNTKVSLLYCATMDDKGKQLLGLRGFSPFFRASVDPTDLFDDLVAKIVAKKIQELHLPTIDQLMGAKSSKEILDIAGKGRVTIQGFGGVAPLSIPWPGLLTPDASEGKTQFAAVDFLWEILIVLRALRVKLVQDYKEQGMERWKGTVDDFAEHLLYLWVIAKGGATSVVVKQQFGRSSSKKFESRVFETWTRSNALEAKGPSDTSSSAKKKPPPPSEEEKEDQSSDHVTEEDIRRATQESINEGVARGETVQPTMTEANFVDITGDEEQQDRVAKKLRFTELLTGEDAEVARKPRAAEPPADQSESNERDQAEDNNQDQDGTGDLPVAQQSLVASAPGGGGDDDDNDDDDDSGEDDDPETACHRKIKRRRLAALRRSETERSKVLAEMAVENHFFQQRKLISDKQRKSATSHWTEQHRRLVGMLSLPGDGNYPRREPTWTKFATSFFKDKALLNAQNIMSQAIKRSWPGTMLKSGISTLISQGFAAPEHRREQMGFSVLHFAPIGHDEDLSQKEKEQIIRTGYGDGVLSEDLVKEYAKKKYFVPLRPDEAIGMLDVCINVLELLCGRGSLATLPYRHGMDILCSHQYEINHAISADKTYLVKFLYFLDGVFQNLVRTLLRCLDYGSPTVQAAAKKVHLLPRQDIEDVLKNFLNNGIPVALPTPTSLVARAGNPTGSGKLVTIGASGKQPGGDGAKGGGGAPPRKSDPKPPELVEEPWHKENPCPVADWTFPANVETKVFFPVEGNFNGKFPRFNHHITNKPCPMCLKYQTNGNCYRGAKCRLSHVPPDNMPQAKRDTVDRVMAEQKKLAIEKKLIE